MIYNKTDNASRHSGESRNPLNRRNFYSSRHCNGPRVKHGVTMGLVFILFVFPASLFAMNLSRDDAVKMILAESHDIKKAAANAERAAAALDNVNANRWFKIDGSVNYMNMIDVKRPLDGMPDVNLAGLAQTTGLPIPPIVIKMPDNIFMAGATLTAPIYTFGKLGHAADSARSAIKIAEIGGDAARREVSYAAAQLYWTAKISEEMVKIAEKSLAQSNRAKSQLASAGRASRANLVKISADITTREMDLENAKFNHESALRMLKIMAGINLDEPVVLTDNLQNEFVAADAEMKNNPDLEMMEFKVKMAESQAKSSRAGAYPTLAATASYNYIRTADSFNNLGKGEGLQNGYWGVALQIPIWDGGAARAQKTMAASEAAAAAADLDKAKKLKTEEFDTAIRQQKHLIENLKKIKTASDWAEKAFDISLNRFANGQTSAVELAEVQSALSQLGMAELDAKYKIIMGAENIEKMK
ncbi:MAG: TolC family protein [Rickettsiales bacterium]|jgi:outer membrane protein TolC|nr:TolC family protein [Rickettsiales bacterium]